MVVRKGIYRNDQVTPCPYEPTYNPNQLEFVGSDSLIHQESFLEAPAFRPGRKERLPQRGKNLS